MFKKENKILFFMLFIVIGMVFDGYLDFKGIEAFMYIDEIRFSDLPFGNHVGFIFAITSSLLGYILHNLYIQNKKGLVKKKTLSEIIISVTFLLGLFILLFFCVQSILEVIGEL